MYSVEDGGIHFFFFFDKKDGGIHCSILNMQQFWFKNM